MPTDVRAARETKFFSVKQTIVAYHQDEEGHWVARLACGHTQHLRHNPPWRNRPWVIAVEGRTRHLGRQLRCRKCTDGAPRDWSA